MRTPSLQFVLKFTCALVLSACAPTVQQANAHLPGGKATSAVINALQLQSINDSIQVPWGLAVLPGGDLLVTERSGQLFRLDAQGEKIEINGVASVHAGGQGGLLDVAVHPDFAQNPWVYFSYAKPLQGKQQTAIARAQLVGDSLQGWTDLYVGDRPSSSSHHFGSRIVLQGGYLYFTIGDRGDRDSNPQDLSRDGGKVYRLFDDGRVPEDNPFAATASARPAIWSYGHRNPQGLSYDALTQQLWLHEHGPKGGDELNNISAGSNYGWPLATFGINYVGTQITEHQTLEGTQTPTWHWTPSIAPSGLTTVSKAKYPSLGDGLLAGSLKFGELHFRPTGDKAVFTVVMDGLQRVRSLTTAADGTVYVGISNAGVFRLIDQNPEN